METLAFIIPIVALSAILLEALFYKKARKQAFDWREGIASFGVAIGQRVVRTVGTGFTFAIFYWVYEHRIFTMPMQSGWTWVALFFLNEFAYYWMHRLSHEVRWMWASHSVHHSAHQLTLSSAYRLGWTGSISGTFVFWLPLVWVGFTPISVLAMMALNLLYQFWLHTELVPRLGFIEGFMNTPSNHRVHHSRNDIYLDKNYGGVIVIYDRLFGTYAPEKKEVPCEFGLVGKSQSLNPFRIALQDWADLLRSMYRSGSLVGAVAVAFRKPGAPVPLRTSLEENQKR